MKAVDSIFTPDLKKQADAIIARYETKRAALLMILRFLQDHYGYISREAELATADYLGIAPIDVREVMSFYTLFYDKPKAKTRFHICDTLACHLAGADNLMKYLEEKLGVGEGKPTPDGAFCWKRVECLGACEMAPMMQLNDTDYVGPLTKEKLDELIDKKRQG